MLRSVGMHIDMGGLIYHLHNSTDTSATISSFTFLFAVTNDKLRGESEKDISVYK